MVTKEQVRQVIVQSIIKFAGQYHKPAEKIQILFQLNKKWDLEYTICVENNPVETVTLSQMIGSNFYNFMISMHIKKVLVRLGDQHKIPYSDVMLVAGTKEDNPGEIYAELRGNNQLIRSVTVDELTK